MKTTVVIFITLLLGALLGYGQESPPGSLPGGTTTGTPTGPTSSSTTGAATGTTTGSSGTGGWKIEYSYSGTVSPAGPGQSGNWQNPPNDPNLNVSHSWTSTSIGSYEVKSEGDITVTVSWDGDPLAAPAQVSVMITSWAMINGGGDIDGNSVVPGYDLNNGYGDTVSEIETPHSTNFMAKSQGVHIKTYPYSGSPITITKHLRAKAWMTAKNATMTAAVDLSAVAATREAYLVPKDIQFTKRADGDLDGDTIFTLTFNDPLAFAVDNYQHFEWSLEGPWSTTSIPVGYDLWSGPNVAIDWNGLDCSYTFTPILYYSYVNGGSYLQRHMDAILADSDAPYSGTPPSRDLSLKVTDQGDGVMADQVLHLKVHCPIDDWVLDSTVAYGTDPSDIVEIMLSGTGKLTTSFDYENTFTRTSEATVSTDYPIKTPFVNIPISVKLGHTFSSSVSQHFTAQSEMSPPSGAVSVVFYYKERIDKKIGRTSSWNKNGLVGTIQQTPCEWFDPNTYRPFIGWRFKNANGEDM